MGTRLSAEEVRKVARLARIALAPEQVEPTRAALGAVLEYVERLRSVDLTGVEPLFSPTDQEATAREDVPGEHLPARQLLDGAPATFERFIRVPRVFGGADDGERA